MANPIIIPETSTSSTSFATSTSGETPSKHLKTTHHHHQDHHNQQPLLPGLPDHIARLCLSRVPPTSLYSVCRAWRRLIYTPYFPPFLSLYALLSPTPSPTSSPSHPYLFHSEQPNSTNLEFHCFDPLSRAWHALPPPLSDPPLRLLIRHPSFLSFNFPIQSVSVSGNLVLLAGTSHDLCPALTRPLIFNPMSGSWSPGPPLSTPRRWCAAGTCRGTVYIASGIGSHFCTDVARSVEKWEVKALTSRQQHYMLKLARYPHNSSERNLTSQSHSNYGFWQKLSCLKDGRFCREAIDAVGWRGKLCMVNVKGDASKEGLVYDVVMDKWDNMPEGMIGGWKGLVASMEEDVMFLVDETKGLLKKYDERWDVWEYVMEDERLKGCQQIAAGGGKVCAVCGDGGGGKVLVVDVVAEVGRAWEVDIPEGFQAVSLHVLPRMNGPDSFGDF